MNLDKTYIDFIKELKQKIRIAKNRATLSVNIAMIELYFDIGKEIVGKQESLGWGKSVVEQMAKDLQATFGKRSGYSTQNLWYMRQFYNTYSHNSNLQQLVGEIPWGHNILIFSKCKEENEQKYYIRATMEQGWSRELLTHHIKVKLFERDRLEAKQHNFQETLSTNLSVLADEMIKSRYNLEFLDVTKEAKELAVEKAIVEQIKEFLLELGYGFSFIDNQYKLKLEDNEYFIDLLFFHRKLNALVAIELKVGKFKPEYAGKMNFYLNILNDKVRMEHENPAIGIILCIDKTGIEVEYALQNIHQPMGVSTYGIKESLPKELKGILPEAEEIARKLEMQNEKSP